MKKDQTKRIIIIVIILLVIVVAYLIYARQFSNTGDPLLSSDTQPELSEERASVIAEEINQQLRRIDSIDLDTAFLKGDLFRSLSDQSQTINEEPVGKNNPFSPFRNAPNSQSVRTQNNNNNNQNNNNN
jgi:regulatory protein YycI of two-component signal transduction system YycFG